ncbi:unnamed protein product [Arabis nemorensis]|uniref:Leucine-rich repeat-containing N-terminal plant-type domain-containing protein n=1 Tax=Arabis nemorensis TaxID=586526 RepID=A0A565CGR1_9BRAS|nr:unnamed protein product [Arabis nemorensis]
MESSLNGPLRSNSSLFRQQHRQSLNLGYNNLSGILPDSIGNFKYLSVLACGSCNFHGNYLLIMISLVKDRIRWY